ncbi:MAG: hypothetical protein Kow0081_2100 [Candidatus Dojkabacteria bacterium]
MIQALQEFLSGPVNFDHVLIIFILYLLVIWALVPMWVFMDARKKYPSSKYMPWILFFIILPFNIPGVIFYIIIRPDEFQLADMNNDGIPDAFFSVPMVNFVSNKKDLVMSLELKINSELIDPRIKRDLNLKVDMQANEDAIKIIEQNVQNSQETEELKGNNIKTIVSERLKAILMGLREYFFKKNETDVIDKRSDRNEGKNRNEKASADSSFVEESKRKSDNEDDK